MKTYRRIEITAFRRKVVITSGQRTASHRTDEGVTINDLDTQIQSDSAEGRRILTDALRVLENELSEPPPDQNVESD